MKKHNTLKVLLIAILFTFLLTWILPITYYSGGLQTDVRYPAGLFDMFNYPTLTLYYFGTIAIYVLAVGAFYGVFNKTGVFKKIVDKIAKLFKGKEILFFITLVTLLAVMVAFCGFNYELIFVLPFVAALIITMGYDKMTVALTFVGSIAVGTIGSLFAKEITGTYLEQLSTTYTDLIWFRVGILVLGIALLVFNIVYRIRKKDIKKEEDKELIPEKVEVKTKKGKVKASWPAIVIFDLIIILMIMGMLDFSGAFNINIFDTFHQNVMSFAIKDYTIFAKILGSTLQNSSLGSWSNSEFTTIIVLATFVLALIYRIKLSDLFENMTSGAKKFGLSAFLMVLAYTVLITTSNHPIVLTILNPLMSITNGFNSVTLSISMFVASIFNIDVYYTASAMVPYAMSIITDTSVYPLVELICQSMHGLAILVAPTSIVLLGTIAYLKINYTEWFKNIWKFFLEVFFLLFIFFIIINLVIA
ncbi:MAG: hypothetical protein IJ068_06275 [Bacilli bacterium]|nr:hypothetical protein [Bacilli bacterium]